VKRILYIEDEESDAFILKYAFQQIGVEDPFDVITDGEQAIRYLSGEGNYADRERFPIPCLILLDLNLPRKSGFEVLEWRRAHSVARLIPVVIFTSSQNAADIRQAYELGAAGYLTKVPGPADCCDRACAIRDFWLDHNIPPSPCTRSVW